MIIEYYGDFDRLIKKQSVRKDISEKEIIRRAKAIKATAYRKFEESEERKPITDIINIK